MGKSPRTGRTCRSSCVRVFRCVVGAWRATFIHSSSRWLNECFAGVILSAPEINWFSSFTAARLFHAVPYRWRFFPVAGSEPAYTLTCHVAPRWRITVTSPSRVGGRVGCFWGTRLAENRDTRRREGPQPGPQPATHTAGRPDTAPRHTQSPVPEARETGRSGGTSGRGERTLAQGRWAPEHAAMARCSRHGVELCADAIAPERALCARLRRR